MSTVLELSARGQNWLAHYGRKGMKWGVRRSRAELASDSEDAAQKKALVKTVKTNKSTDPLSNTELQAVVRRMQLEQQYTQLSAAKKSAGRKFVEGLLGNAAKQQGQVITNQYATQIREEMMKK